MKNPPITWKSARIQQGATRTRDGCQCQPKTARFGGTGAGSGSVRKSRLHYALAKRYGPGHGNGLQPVRYSSEAVSILGNSPNPTPLPIATGVPGAGAHM